MGVAFFISPADDIVRVPDNHIGVVIRGPEKFGLTLSEIEAAYIKYGERIGIEGEARREILLSVIQNGWIRGRGYRNYWSVTARSFTYGGLALPQESYQADFHFLAYPSELCQRYNHSVSQCASSHYQRSISCGGASMIPQEKAAEVISVCILKGREAIERLQSQGHEVGDILLIEFDGYPEICRLENGRLMGRDCVEARVVTAEDKLKATKTEQGFWIKWADNHKDDMAYELEL
jgi:hypothetical protein